MKPIKRASCAVGLALTALSVCAQSMSVEAERERIHALRLEQDRIYQSAEKACYARFAVSDCLRTARADRRAVLGELRRQELILNDLQRQGKAAAAYQRIQDGLTDQALHANPPATASPVDPR